jgi:hypothetical protein
VARRNRRRDAAAPRPLFGGAERREQWRGDIWVVRSVPGEAAVKSYRCPGCSQEIKAGVPHVVAWPAAELSAEGRRHWHTMCWSARDRRR